MKTVELNSPYGQMDLSGLTAQASPKATIENGTFGELQADGSVVFEKVRVGRVPEHWLTPVEADKEWTEEWPTEDNTLWFFYGWRDSAFCKKNNMTKETIVVRVRKLGNGLAYVADGHFLYKKEAEGLFSRIEIPLVPVEERL
jgi:hypothetical protein